MKVPLSAESNTESSKQNESSATLFESIVSDLFADGYSVQTGALPLELGVLLWEKSHSESPTHYHKAGIGRSSGHSINQAIRTDAVAWINSDTKAGDEWLIWIRQMQSYLNQHLYLGLFAFESHFSIYKPGGFYKRHYDAFKGKSNRVLSVIVYLNRDWITKNAGELVLHRNNALGQLSIKPEFGTLVIFLSEEIPHEVLVTTVDRHSIAGWFSTRQVP